MTATTVQSSLVFASAPVLHSLASCALSTATLPEPPPSRLEVPDEPPLNTLINTITTTTISPSPPPPTASPPFPPGIRAIPPPPPPLRRSCTCEVSRRAFGLNFIRYDPCELGSG